MMNATKTFTSALILAGAALVSNSAPCFANLFDQADHFFELRESSLENIAAARAEYLRLAPSLADADLAYAVQQIGKLAVYEGTYLIPDAPENAPRKAQIFDQCREIAGKLKAVPTQVTVYTFWRLSCSALWMRHATVINRLAKIAEVKAEFDELIDVQFEVKAERNIDLRYQGGGINRVLSGIYGDTLSALIRTGLPNGAKALDMAERSLRARGFPGDVNQGTDYYSNHHYKASALIVLRRDAEAQVGLGAAIAEIEERSADGDLPVGMIPETKGELLLLKSMHHRLSFD